MDNIDLVMLRIDLYIEAKVQVLNEDRGYVRLAEAESDLKEALRKFQDETVQQSGVRWGVGQ